MLENELATTVRIARDAGAILMEIYARDFEVAYKNEAHTNPVTEADMKANAFIVGALREAFPDDGIVAEETKDQSDALKGGRCWFVDPLDGTKEFIKKNGEFAVMIGLAIDGDARLGVVFQPAKDKLYAGVVEQGAWLEEAGERRDLRVSEKTTSSELKLVTSRSHRSDNVNAIVEKLGITDEMASGSVGLKVGLIAEQQCDLYVNVSGKTQTWDACGPEAILRAAGGRFTRLDGEPYRYDRENMANVAGLLACNSTAFAAALPAIREVGVRAGLVEAK